MIRFHPLTLILPLTAILPLDAQASDLPPPRPHIIFILADDLGPGDLSCYGGTLLKTPSIDRLAAEGTRFTHYNSASPICSASRAGLITGMFPARWRITSYLQTRAGNQACGQADFLDPAAPSLPRALKNAGYATAHFGKWHLGGGRDVDNAPPFAAYGYSAHAGTWESPQPDPAITSTDWIWAPTDQVKRWERTGYFIDKSLDFLARNPDTPCFVNVWLDDPHTPWVPSADAPEGATRENLIGVMTQLDRQVGRLLDGLATLGVDDRTLVIFTSDNGPRPNFEHLRTTGLRGEKLSLYEGGVRLPFIARWPGHIPAGRTDETTDLAAVDLFPTFCHLAGAPLPPDTPFDGVNRADPLLGTPAPDRAAPLFWEYGRNDTSFSYPVDGYDRSGNIATRQGPWKLITRDDGSSTELFNLSNDPEERSNLAPDHPDITARLKEALLQWRNRLP